MTRLAVLALFALAACGGNSRSDPSRDLAGGGTAGSGGAPDDSGALGGAAGVTAGAAGAAGGDTVDHGFVPWRPPDGFLAEGCTWRALVPGGPFWCVFNAGVFCSTDRDECCSNDECAAGYCVRAQADFGSCCSDAECSAGQCSRTTEPYPGYCSEGPLEPAYNQCLPDACDSHDDCPLGFCTAPGVLPRRECRRGLCRLDADCAERPGGICSYVTSSCPSCATADAAVCVYPGDGCTSPADCPSGSLCLVRDGVAACHALAECPPGDGS